MVAVVVDFVGTAKEAATSNIIAELNKIKVDFAEVASSRVISIALVAARTTAALAIQSSIMVVRTAAAAFQDNQATAPVAEALPARRQLVAG